MKSRKTIMTAVGIFAIVGSALALNSNFFNNTRIYCPNETTGACTDLQTQHYTAVNNGTTPVEPCGASVSWAKTSGTTCPFSGALYPTTQN